MAKKTVKGVDLTSGFFNDEPEEILEDISEKIEKEPVAKDVSKIEAPVSKNDTSSKTDQKKPGRPKKTETEKKKNHNIALHPEVYQQIVDEAQKRHMTISQLIQIAVQEYLN